MKDVILTILEQYRNGKRYFKSLEIEGDFSTQDLRGIIFEECFIAADFKYCNLENAKFVNGNIKTSDFRYSNLKNTIFKNLAVEATQFDWAKTDGLIFHGNSCYGQDLHQADFKELLKTNQSKPKFQVIDTFEITNRGFVLCGEIIEGIIHIGDKIHLDSEVYTISGVEEIRKAEIEYIGLVIPLIGEVDEIQSLKGKMIEIVKHEDFVS